MKEVIFKIQPEDYKVYEEVSSPAKSTLNICFTFFPLLSSQRCFFYHSWSAEERKVARYITPSERVKWKLEGKMKGGRGRVKYGRRLEIWEEKCLRGNGGEVRVNEECCKMEGDGMKWRGG